MYSEPNQYISDQDQKAINDYQYEGELYRDQHPATIYNKEFFHSPYDFKAYLLTTFLKSKKDVGISVLNHVAKSVWIRKDKFYEAIDMLQKKYAFKYIPANDHLFFYKNDCVMLLQRSKGKEFDYVTIYSETKSHADAIFADLDKYDAKIKKISFYWIVNGKGDAIDVIEEWEETVDDTLYPYIPNFSTYAERFFNSKSNILILIGPPGTGKTTFIKHLVGLSNKKVYLTYDETVLSGDGVFAEFISDDSAGSFVIEDADLFLRSRAEGNGMISRFLNIGDGLIKLKQKKLIFSTNLNNISDIDAALIRPGRCFDILSFKSLTREQASVVADARNLILPSDKQEFTLAEIFNAPVKHERKSMGFY